jgi:methionyl-tRNA synthetase
LANGLGNLLNRAVNMLNKYRAGVVPAPSNTLATEATAAVEKTRACYWANDPQGALIAAWELVNRANLFVEETKPFHLAKDPAQAELLDSVLYNLIESCRILAVLVQPVMPATADKIFAQLKVCGEASDWKQSEWGGLTQGHQVGAPIPLFPRKDLIPK